MKLCPQCETQLPPAARYCWQCGLPQVLDVAVAQGSRIDWQFPALPQLNDWFRERFTERVSTEQNPRQLSVYQEKLYSSGFRDIVHQRLSQFLEIALPQQPQTNEAVRQFEKQLIGLIDDLLDYFFIEIAPELNVVGFSQQVLRYQNIPNAIWPLQQLILDYLQLESEQVASYTNLLHLQPRQLSNMAKSFLKADADERILLVCDLSLFGNGKEGFAFSDHAIYWKSGFQPAQRVFFRNIQQVDMQEEWLLINDLYFNASRSINVKMCWLMRKLARGDWEG